MSDGDSDGASDEEEEMQDLKAASSDSEGETEDKVMDKKKADFFEIQDDAEELEYQSFTEMNLSRPLLKGLTEIGFIKPTRIQSMSIPIALMGKDICGGAVTGSGKTAAFLIPIFERLLYRPKSVPLTRILILMPTRELAAQCHSVAVKIAKYTDIRFCLCVGGMSTQQQEQELKTQPDVVIATPGRLIDHVQNTAQFALDNIEILVMDEADRMLEEGFQAELTEIIKSCPRTRQTLLFSATMTDNVDRLIQLSLNKPVRLFIDPTRSVAHNLTQEFIRIRGHIGEGTQQSRQIIDPATLLQREAIILALCSRTYRSRTILFFPSKAECHRMKILFGLHGLNAVELHGNLSQLQRIESLEKFRDGTADFLLATDLAARGLDIAGVDAVINFQMPPTYERYVHRVGRTARYQRSGHAVTLVGEKDRKLVKLAVKNLKPGQSVKQRLIPAAVLSKYRQKIQAAEDKITDIMSEEKEEREMKQAEISIKKAENLVNHAEEIQSRPAKKWFQTEQERQASREAFMKSGLDADDQKKKDQMEQSILEQEIAKEMQKPIKRGPLAGLTRHQKRRKMIAEKEDKATFAKNQAKQKKAAKVSKKLARENGGKLPQVKKQQKKRRGARLSKGFSKDLGKK